MRRRLYVIGTSGLAREMAMVAEQVNAREHRWKFEGFIGEKNAPTGQDLGLGKIVGDDDWFLSQGFPADLIVGIGYPKVRRRIVSAYLAQDERFSFPNFVHPSATLDFRRVELGVGNVITAGCAFTCDISVGDYNLFNLNATVGHDACLGSFNVVNPGVNVSGGVRVGDGVLLGTGCQVLENLVIEDDAVVGAGAVVAKDVAAGLTVVGVPARPLGR